MAQKTAKVDAPIAEYIIADLADEYEIDADTAREILDVVQVGMEPHISEYREQQVVAENEHLLVTLSQYGFNEEAKAAWNKIDADLDEWVEDELATIISKAHYNAFRSAPLRILLTNFTEQQLSVATSGSHPRIIRKPNDAKPTTGELDVEYRIQYGRGYEQPFNFVADAQATVKGDDGTLQIDRTFRAIPDDRSEEPCDEIRVTTESKHVERDILVSLHTESYSLTEELPDTPGRVDEFDDNLRRWVYTNHTGGFVQEYWDMQDYLRIDR
jgi:hypothetical protein